MVSESLLLSGAMNILTMSYENIPLEICRQQWPISDCASAEDDQGFLYPFTESFLIEYCTDNYYQRHF